jgi:hypothetical protein|tara:strand:- start:291 stop:482 length:192 start_codon:yes stop_codon:yes gene_type:complete
MKINMLNADTGEVEVREVDINNPESIMNFVVETKESLNLSDEETDKLLDSIFGTVSDGIVGEA